MDALVILGSSIAAMAPLAIITSTGTVLTKMKIFNSETNDLIAHACAKFFFPIFIFVQLASSIQLDRLGEYWPLLINPLVCIAIASLLGFLHIPLFKPPKSLRFTMVSLIAFNNAGNIPVLILKGVCASYGPLGDEETCDEADAYVFIQVMTFNLLIWVYGYSIMQLDLRHKSEKVHNQFNLIPTNTNTNQQSPGYQMPQDNAEDNAEDDPEESQKSTPQEETQSNDSLTTIQIIKKNVLSPIPICSAFGFILGLIPGLKSVFFDSSAPLLPLSDSAETIGFTGIVVSQMILGSNLILTKGAERKVSNWYTVVVVALRTVIIPLIGMLYTWALWEAGAFQGDVVMAYVGFLSFLSPTAVTVLIMCQLLNNGIEEATSIMLYMYLTSIFTITGFSYTFFLIFV